MRARHVIAIAAAVAIGSTIKLFFVSGPAAEASADGLKTAPSVLAAVQFVDSPRRGAIPAVEAMRIVPADVLGTGVVSWSPLTGDGSN